MGDTAIRGALMEIDDNAPFDGRLSVRLPAELGSAKLARGRLRELLAPVHAPERLSQDADLVLHELVINAVLHGTGDREGMIGVVCLLDPHHLDIRVHDDGTRGSVAVRPWTEDQPSGRGLAMVAALSDSWNVDRSDGTTVSARLSR